MTNVEDLIRQLKAAEAAMQDPPMSSTRAFDEFWARRRVLAATISGLMNFPSDVAREQARLDDLESRRALVVAKIAEVEQAILDAPPWREHPDGRERDRRWAHIDHLRQALARLSEGTLLAAPGVCYEPLDDLDRRIAEVRDRRDRAQMSLDTHLAQAEQLLAAEPVTG